MASRKATNPKQQAESVENLIKYLENKKLDTLTEEVSRVKGNRTNK